MYGFKAIPVYRVEDTEGEPLCVDDHYDMWISQLPLIEVAESCCIKVSTYSNTGKDPLGYFQSGKSGKAIMLCTENLSTFAHELCHAADEHLHTLKDKTPMLEIVAELGSAVLLESIGYSHDADLGGAYSYIERYATAMNKPAVRARIELLDRVCTVVSLIIDEAEKIQQSPAEK